MASVKNNKEKFVPSKDKQNEVKQRIEAEHNKRELANKQSKAKVDEEIDEAITDSDDDSSVLKLEQLTEEHPEKVLKAFETTGLISQGTEVISYSIENLYSDKKNKKFRSRNNLSANPPILKITSSTGAEAKFYLTKELNQQLYYLLGDVKQGYSGFRKLSKHTESDPTIQHGIGKFKAYIKLHSSQVILSAIWLISGLLYSQSFAYASILFAMIGLFMIFYPHQHNNKK